MDVTGRRLDFVGDAVRETYWRSAAKPFQLLPFAERDGITRFGLTQPEIAIMASSHGGEVLHTELVLSVLTKAGLGPEALCCGVAAPLYQRRAAEMQRLGEPFSAVNNNCSGKHSCMLSLAQIIGAPIAGYFELTHPVQQLILAAVADSVGLQPEQIGTGVDGCGVPVFWLPIHNMAWAYARLAQPEKGQWGEREVHIRTIRDAMCANPRVIGGTDFFETVLMTVTKGRILAKAGAESIYCLGALPEGVGIAYKIDDGGARAVAPVGIALLKRLGLISAAEHKELLTHFPPEIKNHRGDIVGMFEPII